MESQITQRKNSIRSEYWDGWKAVCIIVVIALHTISPPEMFPVGSLKWYVDVAFFQFILFPVPIFLAIAGFFALGRSSDLRFRNVMDYYKRRLARILPPYLIWTTAFILLEHRSDLSSIRESSKDLLLGTGIGIGYFVIVLIQFTLLTPLLANLTNRRTHIILMSALFGCGLLTTYVGRIEYPLGEFARFPFYCLCFVVWYPFYHLGLFAAKFRIADKSSFGRSVTRTRMFLLYAFLVGASCIEGIFLSRRGYPLGLSQLKATSLLASLALFFLVLAYQRISLGSVLANRFIQLLGRSSYMVYLMHMLVLHKIEILLKKDASISSHHLLYSLISFALTLMLSVFLAGFIERTSPRIGKLLGASSGMHRTAGACDPKAETVTISN